MTAADDAGDRRPRGATTAPSGTPFPVDLARDRRARSTWARLVGGPIVAATHFAVVYLAAEAGCTGGGPGLEVLDPPAPERLALVATAVAAVASLLLAAWGASAWRARRSEPAPAAGELPHHDADGTIALAGTLLAALALVTVLFVGVPAAFLAPC